jgi:hypothetical protein
MSNIKLLMRWIKLHKPFLKLYISNIKHHLLHIKQRKPPQRLHKPNIKHQTPSLKLQTRCFKCENPFRKQYIGHRILNSEVSSRNTKSLCSL